MENLEPIQKNEVIFFDLETTGKSVKDDRIVEIAVQKTDFDFVPIDEPKRYLINPEMPIPAEASAIHGITDEMVKDAPTFSQLAPSMLQYFIGCWLAGYNIEFYDVPLLSEEFGRCDIIYPVVRPKIIDCCRIFKNYERRDLSAAYKFYTGEDMENAHSAIADNNATIAIAKGQRFFYNLDMQGMSVLSDNPDAVDFAGKIIMKDGHPVFSFGQHVGQKVVDNPKFVEWMLSKDFTNNTKNVVKAIIDAKKTNS